MGTAGCGLNRFGGSGLVPPKYLYLFLINIHATADESDIPVKTSSTDEPKGIHIPVKTNSADEANQEPRIAARLQVAAGRAGPTKSAIADGIQMTAGAAKPAPDGFFIISMLNWLEEEDQQQQLHLEEHFPGDKALPNPELEDSNSSATAQSVRYLAPLDVDRSRLEDKAEGSTLHNCASVTKSDRRVLMLGGNPVEYGPSAGRAVECKPRTAVPVKPIHSALGGRRTRTLPDFPGMPCPDDRRRRTQ